MWMFDKDSILIQLGSDGGNVSQFVTKEGNCFLSVFSSRVLSKQTSGIQCKTPVKVRPQLTFFCILRGFRAQHYWNHYYLTTTFLYQDSRQKLLMKGFYLVLLFKIYAFKGSFAYFALNKGINYPIYTYFSHIICKTP